MTTQQLGLQITGHNISNAATRGFHRQSIAFEALGGTAQGVRVAGIRRSQDLFLSSQLGAQAGQWGLANARADALDRLEDTVGSLGEFGLGGYLDRFYSAWRGLGGAAHDEFQRTETLSKTGDLVSAINRTAKDFREAQEQADEEIVRGVEEANELIDEVAALNREIMSDEAYGGDANELRDRRDILAERLGELVGATYFINKKDHMIVTLSGGVAVVTGIKTQNIEAKLDATTGFHDVILKDTVNMSVKDVMASGRIKGFFTIRDTDIAARITELDTFASEIVTAANAIHQANFNLNGVNNVDLFTPLGAVAGAGENISVNAALVGDPDLLAASSDAAQVPGNGVGAQAMADMEFQDVGGGNTQTLSESINQILTNLGYSVREATDSEERHLLRYEQLQGLRESSSGVSIEEEMIQLSRFQRSFQAASRIVSTVDQMLGVIVQL